MVPNSKRLAVMFVCLEFEYVCLRPCFRRAPWETKNLSAKTRLAGAGFPAKERALYFCAITTTPASVQGLLFAQDRRQRPVRHISQYLKSTKRFMTKEQVLIYKVHMGES